MPAYHPGQGLNKEALERLRARKLAEGGGSLHFPSQDESQQRDSLLGGDAKKKPRCGICTRPLGIQEQAYGQLLCPRCAAPKKDEASALHAAFHNERRSKSCAAAKEAAVVEASCVTPLTDAASEDTEAAAGDCAEPSTAAGRAAEQFELLTARKHLEGKWACDDGTLYEVDFQGKSLGTCKVVGGLRNFTLWCDTTSKVIWWGNDKTYYVNASEICSGTDRVVWRCNPASRSGGPPMEHTWHRPCTSPKREKKLAPATQKEEATTKADSGTEWASHEDARAHAVKEIEGQLQQPGSDGHVQNQQRLGALKHFLGSCSDRFVVHPGDGKDCKDYTVTLAHPSAAAAGTKASKVAAGEATGSAAVAAAAGQPGLPAAREELKGEQASDDGWGFEAPKASAEEAAGPNTASASPAGQPDLPAAREELKGEQASDVGRGFEAPKACAEEAAGPDTAADELKGEQASYDGQDFKAPNAAAEETAGPDTAAAAAPAEQPELPAARKRLEGEMVSDDGQCFKAPKPAAEEAAGPDTTAAAPAEQPELPAAGKHLEGDWVSDDGQCFRVRFHNRSSGTCAIVSGKHGRFTLSCDATHKVIWWGIRKAYYLDVVELRGSADRVTWHCNPTSGDRPARAEYRWRRKPGQGITAESQWVWRPRQAPTAMATPSPSAPRAAVTVARRVPATRLWEPRAEAAQPEETKAEAEGAVLEAATEAPAPAATRSRPAAADVPWTMLASIAAAPPAPPSMPTAKAAAPAGATAVPTAKAAESQAATSVPATKATAPAAATSVPVAKAAAKAATPPAATSTTAAKATERPCATWVPTIKAAAQAVRRAVPLTATWAPLSRQELEAEVLQEVEDQLLASSGDYVWISNWQKRYGRHLGQLRSFLEKHPKKFTVIPMGNKGFRVALVQ